MKKQRILSKSKTKHRIKAKSSGRNNNEGRNNLMAKLRTKYRKRSFAKALFPKQRS